MGCGPNSIENRLKSRQLNPLALELVSLVVLAHPANGPFRMVALVTSDYRHPLPRPTVNRSLRCCAHAHLALRIEERFAWDPVVSGQEEPGGLGRLVAQGAA